MMTGEACPVCGARHAVCGPASPVVPVDLPTTIPTTRGTPVMKKYRTTINNTETILKLSDADAKAWEGAELTEVTEGQGGTEAKAAKPAANKARSGAQADKS